MSEALRVLVTGGASGIGAAAVERFRHEGATVAALDRDERQLSAVAADVRIAADVAQARELEAAVTSVAAELGGLDVVVNSAGVPSRGSVVDTSPDDWDHVFSINVRGTYLCAKAAIPHLRRAGGG